MEHVSRTQYYLKVKKPELERQRRARINKCLDAMKLLVADLQKDDAILRMDKADMLEATITHLRQVKSTSQRRKQLPEDSIRNGYINAANEVSRVLASTRGVSPALGKAIMTHLGNQFNRLDEVFQQQQTTACQPLTVSVASAPASPASSGYHSDSERSMASPVARQEANQKLWRPW